MPACSPTRASFLTGQLPSQHGISQALTPVANPENKQLNPKRCLIKKQWTNEKKICFGKWHLGPNTPNHPIKCGFDYFSGTEKNVTDYYDHNTWNWSSSDGNHLPHIDGEYLLDYTKREFERVIQANASENLFVIFNCHTPHSPYEDPTREYYFTLTSSSFLKMCEATDHMLNFVLEELRNSHTEGILRVFGDNGTPGEYNTGTRAKGTTGEGGIRTTLFHNKKKIHNKLASVLDVCKRAIPIQLEKIVVSQKILPIKTREISKMDNLQVASITYHNNARYKYEYTYKKDKGVSKTLWYRLYEDSFQEDEIDPTDFIPESLRNKMINHAMKRISP
jgi:arylsulfatase A-like enzyme